MEQPLISIITATYNSEKTLGAFFKSVRDQTYKNFELIIIDGASTDNTVKIIIEQHNLGAIKWISEPDKGIYDAWNKGLKMVEGEWISFMGSDDVFYPTALADYVDFINLNDDERLEYLSSKMHLVNNNNKIIKSVGSPWSWETCRLQNVIAHPGSLHNKSLFEKFGNFSIEYKICSDYEFLLRPGEKFKTAYMDKFTVAMAMGGVSSNGNKLFKEHYKIVTTTGKLSKGIAQYYYLLQVFKYYVKSAIRKLGVNV